MRRESVTSQDGVHSELSVFETSIEDASTVVVCMPAMGVAASYYEPLGQMLADRGIHAVLGELRGNGTSSVRASRSENFGYFEMVHYDYPAIMARVRGLFPGKQIVLLGHSLGGQLGALYTGIAEEPPTALILVASCNVHYRAWRSPLKILGGVLTMRALGNIFGYVPGKQVGFGGREARGVIIDWSNNCMRGTYRLLNSSVDYHEKMAAVQRPVFALTFENDWLAPKEAAENLYRCLSSATVEHTHIEKNDPDFIDVSHFNWARRPKGAMKYIERWLAKL